MHPCTRALALFVSTIVLAAIAGAQGIPLENILRDGLKKPGSSGTPPQSPPQQQPGQQTPPGNRTSVPPIASNATPGGGSAPFDIRLPQGWRAQLTEESGVLAQSPDGASMVAIVPIQNLGNLSAAQWLQRNGATFVSRYLPRAATAAIYPSRLGAAGALASLEFQSAGRPGKSSALLFTHGGMGTLYVIGAPAQSFEQARPALLNILRSFSFRGERTQSAPNPGAPGVAVPGMAWKKYQDPSEQAFTVEVPANWQVDGGLVRKSTVDVNSVIRTVSPDGIVVIWGDRDVPKFVLPSPTMAMSGLHEGSQYSPFPGNVMIVSRYLPGAAFAQVHAGRLAQAYGVSNMRMGQPRPRTDLDQNIPSIGTRIRGGEVDFTGSRNSRECEGYVMAATSEMTMQGVESGVWNVQLLVSYIAPKGMSSTARAVISHMLGSVQINPQWVRQQRQMTEQTYRAVKETNDYISKLFRETREENQRVQDRQHREFGDVIRGVVRLRDPESGEVVEGRAGNNYYWRIRNTDTLVGSDLPDPPPNVDVTELEQVR